MPFFTLFFILFTLFSSDLRAEEKPDFSVMHQGRIRPFSLTGQEFSDKLLVIPDKYKNDWRPLSDLKNNSNKNISSFSDKTYFDLVKVSLQNDEGAIRKELANAYPSTVRFQAELWYYLLPWKVITVGFYTLAGLLFLFQKRFAALFFFVPAFLLHTSILLLRCFILDRPPVSNMQETVIYVPWVGSLLALFWTLHYKDALPGLVGSFLAAILLLTPVTEGMENVQPVLNSHFWLIIHVMMIVASYGVLIFAALLGHIYLFTKNQKAAQYILPTIYIGVALLIPGTILGGVWALESWGRFWDWDPKESWAFISASIYLMVIHAQHFGKISHFGVAIGSLIGLMSISFTWYGVNYILGTGLHSYGFGSGGEIYYWVFLAVELSIIATALIINGLKINNRCDNK